MALDHRSLDVVAPLERTEQLIALLLIKGSSDLADRVDRIDHCCFVVKAQGFEQTRKGFGVFASS